MRKVLFVLVALLFCSAARSEYRQKLVTHFSLNDPKVPAEVLQDAKPTRWQNTERGPVPDLQFFNYEDARATDSNSRRQSSATRDAVCWLGCSDGAARFDPTANHPWDRWQYFAGPRWLPDNHVRNIVVRDDGGSRFVWIRTDTGISRIEWRPMTLAEKAAHFDDLIEQHHLRHGFVADCRLRGPGKLESSYTVDNDNDGLWTAMYLAAETYRFAVTHEAPARDHANRAFNALVRLLDITGNPGFPARSILAADEPHGGGEWHPTADGKWLWKGDTSSDELVGHYYGHALFFDLLANDQQKTTIRRVMRAMTDHLIEHDYDLVDLDGHPTRWGEWSERFFATEEGHYEKALRSLELLSFLKTAYHITGDEKYERAYRDRIDRGYDQFLLAYRRWQGGGEINFSDDELAYLSIDPLLRYETDSSLRKTYLDELRFVWDTIQPDRNPLWNYISVASGAGKLNAALALDSRETLERIPWLPIDWTVHNSQRIDVHLQSQNNRFGRSELKETVAPDERPQEKWNGDPYVPDSGGDGKYLECGTYFLLPYWMGRYHGWLTD
ncbi:hypothetical protein GC207_03205 [bacterium]|nr:hypothetical protein [bacterium]